MSIPGLTEFKINEPTERPKPQPAWTENTSRLQELSREKDTLLLQRDDTEKRLNTVTAQLREIARETDNLEKLAGLSPEDAAGCHRKLVKLEERRAELSTVKAGIERQLKVWEDREAKFPKAEYDRLMKIEDLRRNVGPLPAAERPTEYAPGGTHVYGG